MVHALFSFQGRMNRAPYWGWSLLAILVFAAVLVAIAVKVGLETGNVNDAELQSRIEGAVRLPILVLTLATLWPLCAIVAKRLHDLDKPTWLTVPIMLPSLIQVGLGLAFDQRALESGPLALLSTGMVVLALVFSIYLGCVRGTRGPNRFGPDPLAWKDRGAAGDLPAAPAR